ncbi:MAG: glycosyltransferase family 2 protein [Prevotella sp.]|nr:glycosyltransferase family 2 protein [Prevotella sp.]MBQ6033476.1 glycosyltransferase family 2 protein [Prevotella sp.]MBQ6658654.1 glycosyltransferase family 2 protein [Prevotella sp.]MBQ7716360.1 glycosyltransferase family 2 protein [Prevotella sp.]MBQ9570368.1 glycosyltransferase family 2 protein [Prevotella sp.]
MKTVTLLIPCYNEEESIPFMRDALLQLMNDNTRYQWEVLFINDGSRDRTLSLLEHLHQQDKRFCYVSLSRNFGKEAAMLAGFDHARGDAVIIMDADLQHPPQVIPQMLAAWEEGYDDVYGKRLSRGRESWLRRKLSMSYYRLLQRMAHVDILPNVGDFRLLDRRCIEVLKQLRETERYTKGLYCWIGFNKKEVPFETQDRVAGKSTWSYRQLIGLAIDGIMSFTTAPLRISAILGIVVSIIAFIYMCVVLAKTLFWGEPVAGYPTIVVLVLFLGGVQLISLGIVGEYLGKTFMEVKNRPVYVVDKLAINDNPSEE